jgi:hypothetical protein
MRDTVPTAIASAIVAPFGRASISATGSKRRVSARWALVATIMLALTGHGMSAQMTKLPGNDGLIGHPCHDKYLIDRGDRYAKMAILNGEIKTVAFELNERGLPDGITLAPEMCALLRQVNEVQDEILSDWYAERQCNNNASDQSYFQAKIDERLGYKAKTVKS